VTPLWLAINHQVEMFAAVGEDGESGGQPVRFSDVYFFFIVLCGIIKFRYLDSPEYTAEQSGWHKYMAPLIFGNVRYQENFSTPTVSCNLLREWLGVRPRAEFIVGR